MMTRTVLVTTDERGIATLELNRPDKHNALSEAMFGELREAFASLAADPAVRVVVLTGRGGSFCAGGDLTWFLQSLDETTEARVARSRLLGDLLAQIDALPKPLIGRINGLAIGAGAGLVSVCDITVGLERCAFGFSETRIGLIPATFAPYVIRRIGPARARSVMLSGARFDAEKACRIGLLDEICADEAELDARVARIAQDHLPASPEAIAMTKELIDHVAGLGIEEARAWSAAKVGEAWERGDAHIRVPRLLGSGKPATG